MKRTKYKLKFNELHINNRWNKPFWNRTESWVLFGFSKYYFSPIKLEYIIHLFGIDFRFWFNRIHQANA